MVVLAQTVPPELQRFVHVRLELPELQRLVVVRLELRSVLELVGGFSALSWFVPRILKQPRCIGAALFCGGHDAGSGGQLRSFA